MSRLSCQKVKLVRLLRFHDCFGKKQSIKRQHLYFHMAQVEKAKGLWEDDLEIVNVDLVVLQANTLLRILMCA